MRLVYLIIIILILLYFIPGTVEIGDGAARKWNVVGGYTNNSEAARKISRINARIIKFLAYLQQKYEGVPPCRKANIVRAILTNYNPDKFYENDPKLGKGTSFTINKGEKMFICMRQKNKPLSFVDDNTLIFVMLHEMSHIGNYDGWGHEVDFWAVFKFVLQEAIAAGLYYPVHYDKQPVMYCGVNIDYNPFYDSGIGLL